MPRLFISHSSKDHIAAVAFKQWLGAHGWPDEDVFLDLDDIGAGERWKDALNKANARCEAVVLLASPEALSSPECLAEVRKAEDNGKEIVIILLHDLQFDDRRLDSYKDRQIVDLSAPPQSHVETVDYRGEQHEVRFNGNALTKVKEFLFKRGIAPDRFAWPPEDRPNAEPLPGLSAFTEDDAGIFFGRDSDIIRGLDKLRVLRRNGLPRLLVIQAASGAGKSSYLRAGLWPRLNRDPDFAPVAILRPAQGILTGPEGLGRKLAARLSRPGQPISPGEIHAQLMAKDTANGAADFARFMKTAATQAHEQRRIGDREARRPALIFAIDQAEELFGADDRTESERFLFLLASVMRQVPVPVESYCLFTVRADDAARLFQAIADLNLEIPETLPLLPLPQSSYREVILRPLDVLAGRGQRLTLDPRLVDNLVADATGADALPLLAFTMSHLYREFSATRSLKLEQYEGIGGIAGSIDMALKQALAKPGNAPVIPAAKDEQLAQLRAAFIPWLARVNPDTGVPMRRIARLDQFPPTSRGLVERLVQARLLISDQRSGADVIEVAHESLLRQWPALSAWLQADADDLKLIEDVERAAAEWDRKGKLDAWIDHRAERLYLAETLVRRKDFHGRFSENVTEYLVACRAHESPAFRRVGVDLLPLGLERAGLDARSFPWPPTSDPNRTPFRGLRSLVKEDAAVFFGRDQDILRALQRIRDLVETNSENFLIILGASGVGKSSFLCAGLWPRLARYSSDFILLPVIRADDAQNIYKQLATALTEALGPLGATHKQSHIVEMLSGSTSAFGQFLDELVILKKRSITKDHLNPTIILPIDQMHHLFIDSNENSGKFRDLLADILASNRRIVLTATMRSDKYHLLETDPRFSSTKQELFNLPPLRDAELHEVISEPATLTSARYETADVPAKLAKEGAQEASVLPLLAFLLEDTWLNMVARGDGTLRLPPEGLGGVFVERAESFFANHSGSEDRIRRLFIPKLVAMREDGEPIRRVAGRHEFSDEEWQIVSELADHPYRLIIVATHETGAAYAEVAHEAIFRSWPRLRSWLEEERAFLLLGARIETFYIEWQAGSKKNDALLRGQALADAEYWLASRADDVSIEIRRYVQRSKRRASRRQKLIVASAFVFALLFFIASWQSFQAIRQHKAAEISLTQAQAERDRANIANLRTGSVISPDGSRLLALDPNGRVRVINLASGREVGVISTGGDITSAVFSHDGARIATGGTTREIEIWDAATLGQIGGLRGATGTIRRVAFSPDGVLIASGGDDNTARVWSLQTGQMIFSIRVSADMVALGFSPDEKKLTVSTADGALYIVDLATGQVTIGIRG